MKLLRLAPENTKFPFMRFRRVSYPFSALLSIISVVLFLSLGMNFGIDFSGGTLLELRAKNGVADLAKLRSIGEHLKVGDVEVQGFGGPSDVTMRFGLQAGGDAAQQAAVNRVKEAIGDGYEVRRTEVVGPRVSGELVQSGGFHDPQPDRRVGGAKAVRPQAGEIETGIDAYGQDRRDPLRLEPFRRVGDAVKTFLHGRHVLLPGGSQDELLVQPLEQMHTKTLL